MKLNMAKSYDRHEWDFIECTLKAMGSPNKMNDNIVNCIRSFSFSILINGNPTRVFRPSIGIRQGDQIFCISLFYVLRSFRTC